MVIAFRFHGFTTVLNSDEECWFSSMSVCKQSAQYTENRTNDVAQRTAWMPMRPLFAASRTSAGGFHPPLAPCNISLTNWIRDSCDSETVQRRMFA